MFEEMYMKYKAVIFDMDGVIFDSERLSLACWEETAKKFGLTGIERYCDLSRGVNEAGSAKIFYSLYGENGLTYEECRAENSRLFHSRYDGGRLPMKKGVTELLPYLKEKGWIVGLASSTKEATVTQEIRDAGLMPYFDNLTCGDMLKKSKPEPDIFLMACEKLAVKPQEAIIIEDSHNGIRAASCAGAMPVMVPDMMPVTEEMKELAYKICKDLLEVRIWLDKNFPRD